MLKQFLAAGGLVLLAPLAHAHATLAEREATVGATTKITLRVPHGCDGQATHTVRLDLPQGFYNAKPVPKAGWDLSTETGAYDAPFVNHGTTMTEGTVSVTWSGGNLEDGWYDEFVVRGTVGPDVPGGQILYFPAVQECADAVADWTDTSGGDVDNPAPKLITVAASGGGHGHGHDHSHGAAEAASVTVGDLTIAAPFSRATLPNAPVAGGFMTVTNSGSADDRLIDARSGIAGRVEIHEMKLVEDVMRMRELEGGLTIPAGETVTLEPGGFHVMLMDLKGPLVEGETVEVTLVFETAGEVTVPLAIGAADARAASAHSHH